MDIKDNYQACFISFLIRKKRSGVSVNKELAKVCWKKNIKEFKRRKIYARFNPNLGER